MCTRVQRRSRHCIIIHASISITPASTHHYLIYSICFRCTALCILCSQSNLFWGGVGWPELGNQRARWGWECTCRLSVV
ncbi:hypothetical protein K438DRAFT_1800864 [Mycena galopus ATCC 62051]|nr:hypothetical protein K438DRAFT_1800864 [Mycena galopus ATCC 62051]